MDLHDLETLTQEHGQGWAWPHVRRLLALIAQIDAGLDYDRTALTYAVYLHDWGAFPRYALPGVDHALRSAQVAREEVLPHTPLSATQAAIAVEAIALHDYRHPGPTPTPEACLLREADCLDFLGATGIARDFAWGPNNLQVCFNRIQGRKAAAARLTLPAAQALAAPRLERMDAFLSALSEETGGVL